MRGTVLAICAALLWAVPLVAREPAAVRWAEDLARFARQDALSPLPVEPVLFVGSSSIRLWDLSKSFPRAKLLNRGFGGSEMSDSVELAEKIILPYRPRAIIVYAGDNDIAKGKSPERVADDFRALVAKVHAALPNTTIEVISIKPSFKRWALVEKMRAANARLRDFAKTDRRLGYLDVHSAMLGDDGQPRRELFEPDGLHLNAKGYELWSGLLVKHSKALAPR